MSNIVKFRAPNLACRIVGTVVTVLSFSMLAIAQHYQQTNLVSDLPNLAAHTDPNLVNPWGIARSATGPWWVADNGTGVSTLYNGTGTPFPVNAPLVVTIPPPPGGQLPSTPTGIVSNGTADFTIAPGKPALFIFATEDGTISGWNPAVDPTNAILKVNRSGRAVYKGLTLSEVGGRHFLYAANFRSGQIEVFDSNFQRFRFSNQSFDNEDNHKDSNSERSRSSHEAFTDEELPRGFAPFNVQAVGQNLYVTFAKQDQDKRDEVDGAGLGFVDVFSPTGKLLQRLQHGPWFNAPWGIALAPGDFGEFSHELLVGNFGSGEIAAFNPVTGKFIGRALNPDGSILVIDGLWAIGFGNSALAGPFNSLFFSAGIEKEQHGLFGTLTAIASEQDGDEP